MMKHAITMHRFLIVIEDAGENFSAYSPDLPGCVATGATRDEAERSMYEAIQMHIEGLREDGLPIPQSTAFAEYVVVGA
jgi:predicted RNase H-like HicB family nuclease